MLSPNLLEFALMLFMNLLAITLTLFLNLMAITLTLSLKLGHLFLKLLVTALTLPLLGIRLMLSLNLLKISRLTINMALQHGRIIIVGMTTRPSCLCIVHPLLAESELIRNREWHHL
jgi:hypothetical protein